jgi:hypothetical protein
MTAHNPETCSQNAIFEKPGGKEGNNWGQETHEQPTENRTNLHCGYATSCYRAAAAFVKELNKRGQWEAMMILN